MVVIRVVVVAVIRVIITSVGISVMRITVPPAVPAVTPAYAKPPGIVMVRIISVAIIISGVVERIIKPGVIRAVITRVEWIVVNVY